MNDLIIILKDFLTLTGGIVWVGIILALLWLILSWICTYLDRTFNIAFFFDYFIRGKYKNLDQGYCREFSHGALRFHNTNSIADRTFRYGVYLINKRNKHYVGYHDPETGASIKKPIKKED